MTTAIRAPCDTASIRTAQPKETARHPHLVLAATILASSLAFVDGSVVNVGLPAIGKALGADARDLQWIVNAYLLPLSALLLFGGAAGDRYGGRVLLIVGVAVFALSSLVCAIATNLGWLLAGRLAQGIGAAMLMPNSLAILGQTFTGEAKGRAVGIWAATAAIAGAIGPVVGGWLIDLGSWRGIFLLNLPLAAAAILIAWRYIPRDPPSDGRPLDGLGALLATFALALLTIGLTEGTGRHGWSIWALAALVTGSTITVWFVLVEKRRGDDAMLPLALFGSNEFLGLTLLTLLLYAAFSGILILIPYVLITSAGYSATAAGASLLPLPIVLALASPMVGALSGRIGARMPLVAGPLIVAVGFLLTFRIGTDENYWTDVMPAVLVIAIGMSVAVAPLTTAVLGSVDQRHVGSASGVNSAVARTGGMIATALIGSVLAAQGASLLSAFKIAAAIGAAACVAASLCAFLLVPPRSAMR